MNDFDYEMNVRFDAANMTLEIDPPRRRIVVGSNVRWRFHNLPDGWSPALQFLDAGPGNEGYFGPFASVRQDGESVSGTDAMAADTPVRYRAIIERGVGSLGRANAAVIVSADAELTLDAGRAQSRVKTVEVREVDGSLVVSNENVHVQVGDRVVWQFRSVLEKYPEWQPLVLFGAPLIAGIQPPLEEFLGPFRSLEYRRAEGTITGVGLRGLKGVFPYELLVFNAGTRQIVIRASHDPAIDDEGDVSPY